MKPVVRVLTDTVEKGLASLADAIVRVTPPLADKFRHRNRIVAYNYPAKEFCDRATKAKQQSRNRDFDIVHLGTLNLKRAIFLADVIKEFHQLQPGACSLVIGVPADIEAAIKGLIPDGCVLLGTTPYDNVNFKHADGLARLVRRHPELSVGCHVNPIVGRPVMAADKVPTSLDENGAFFCKTFTRRFLSGYIRLAELRAEMTAQVEKARGLAGTAF